MKAPKGTVIRTRLPDDILASFMIPAGAVGPDDKLTVRLTLEGGQITRRELIVEPVLVKP